MKKILIVDDERDIVECLDMNLRKKGYATAYACDGTEAVLAARRERPDCILLDVMLPKISGIEVCHLLKADQATGHIPVIMLTAKGEEDDKDLAIYPDKYVVEQDGRRVDLTPTEFGILRVLAEHRGNIVTRNELNEALGFSNNGGEIRSLDVHLRNLRKKLGDDIQECRYIETIRRIGFRINE